MSLIAHPEYAADVETLADLVRRLGDIPLERIRMHPAPGTATEDDVAAAVRPTCELVDGVLVERAMGYFESRLATLLVFYFESWLTNNNVGYCNGDGALTRLQYGLVRVPDVSVIRWERTKDRTVPRDPICGISPNLAVEVLSRSNTRREIDRKRREYFAAAVELVWIVDPEIVTVEIWTSAENFTVLHVDDFLDGCLVLPGFRLSIREWFERAEGSRLMP